MYFCIEIKSTYEDSCLTFSSTLKPKIKNCIKLNDYKNVKCRKLNVF